MKSLLVLLRTAQLLPIDKRKKDIKLWFDDYEDTRPETCPVKQLGQECDCESACMGS